MLRCLSDVQRQSIDWLWPGRIAKGKLTLLCGDPGLGKSLITLDIAARVSRGAPWPEEEHPATSADPTVHEIQPSTLSQSTIRNPKSEIPNPSSVILLSAEDDPADTIRPRLEILGADLKRITTLQSVRHTQYTPWGEQTHHEAAFSLRDDIRALALAIEKTPGTSFVVIDPISAYLSGYESVHSSQVRGLLAPLAELAANAGVAIVAVTHLNKSAGVPTIYRSVGSLAFAAAARAVWIVAQDPHDCRRRLLLPVKNNLAGDGNGLAFRIEFPAGSGQPPLVQKSGTSRASSPLVKWETTPITTHPDQLLTAAGGNGRDAPEREFAEGWLREALSEGPLSAREVKRNALENGIALRTLRRARQSLRVVVRKSSFQGGWQWSLPD